MRIRFARTTLAAAALIATLGMAGPSTAAGLVTSEESQVEEPFAPQGPWSMRFTAYSWITWLKGDTTVRGRNLAVDYSPIDVIEALDWPGLPVWMHYAEVNYDRFAIFNDLVYARLSGSGSFSASGAGATLTGTITGTQEQLVTELGGAYTVWRDAPLGTPGSTQFDVLAGGRYWYQKITLAATVDISGTLAGLPVVGGRAIARSGRVVWIDPFVGFRVRHKIAEGHELSFRGDIGGFGLGSDFSWQALATYNVELYSDDSFALDGYLGYRALSVDYSKGRGNGRYEYDVVQHGPVLGLTVRF